MGIGSRGLRLAAALALGLAWGPAPGQPAAAPRPPAIPGDSAAGRPPIPPAAQTVQDSLPEKAAARPDSTRAKSRGDSVIVVKHSFNHREQIITGSVIMTCLALILVAMNNYNPR
jgi:hypothetical protein